MMVSKSQAVKLEELARQLVRNLEASQPIGGHDGLLVYRTPEGILKVALYERNRLELGNELEFVLTMVERGGHVPNIVGMPNGRPVIQALFEDLGESQPVTDSEAFRRNLIDLLWDLRDEGIIHGDLTAANIIVRDNTPWLIDFADAQNIGPDVVRRQAVADSATALMALANWPGELDTTRIARRWLAILDHLGADRDLGLPLRGKTLLDLGCYRGDFVALAACEGMIASGFDHGNFLPGEDSIAWARERWSHLPVGFEYADIMKLDTFDFDVVLLFSVWPYLVRDHGRDAAEAKLSEIIHDCGTLFFETQLLGDGPGPEFLRSDADVRSLLTRHASEVTKLVTIPVAGRDASRTLWAVRQ